MLIKIATYFLKFRYVHLNKFSIFLYIIFFILSLQSFYYPDKAINRIPLLIAVFGMIRYISHIKDIKLQLNFNSALKSEIGKTISKYVSNNIDCVVIKEQLYLKKSYKRKTCAKVTYVINNTSVDIYYYCDDFGSRLKSKILI